MAGSSETKSNLAQLGLELGLSLAINGISITSMSRAGGKCPKQLFYSPVGFRDSKNISAPFFETPCIMSLIVFYLFNMST